MHAHLWLGQVGGHIRFSTYWISQWPHKLLQASHRHHGVHTLLILQAGWSYTSIEAGHSVRQMQLVEGTKGVNLYTQHIP